MKKKQQEQTKSPPDLNIGDVVYCSERQQTGIVRGKRMLDGREQLLIHWYKQYELN